MKFSYNWLKTYLNLELEPEKLSELLELYSYEVEALEKKGDDWILDIDILPNRAPDSFSHLGIAREIKAILNIKKDKELKLNRPSRYDLGSPEGEKHIIIEKPGLCPRYSYALLERISVEKSPNWLREHLKACGLEPINNIVDAANYVMLEYGQPLHTFDFDKLTGDKVYIRRAKDGESLETLDDETKKLDRDTLVIADKESPIALAGIKGGKKTGVDEHTDTILLEAANFDSNNIRKTSKRLKINSDAATRFSQNLSPELAEVGLSRLVELLSEIAGGEFKLWEDSYLEKEENPSIAFDIENAQKLAGIEITPSEVEAIFSELQFEFEKKEDGTYRVEPPYFRQDIKIEEDLIEEVIRLKGYDDLPAELPKSPLSSPSVPETISFREEAKDILSGLGYSEVLNYTFVGEDEIEKLRFDPKNVVEVKNPLSKNLNRLRPNLGPGLVKSLYKHQKDSAAARLFEIGKVFRLKEDKTIEEKWQLGLACLLQDETEFYELKGIVDEFTNGIGLSEIYFDDTIDSDNFPEFFHQGKRAEIQAGSEVIGWAGELKPYLCDLKGIHEGAAIALLDFEKLTELCEGEWEYRPPSKFPTVERDLAILVQSDVKFSQILDIINGLPVDLVQDVDLFDLYQGENISEAKKSFAFHITYGSDKKTLTDEEVNEQHKKIEQALKEELGAEIR